MAKISTKHVAEAIYQSVKSKRGTELRDSLANAVEFLAKKNLFSKTPEILKHLENFSDIDQKIIRAKISSSKPPTKKMTDKLESLLKKRYGAKDAVLLWQEDKTLVGGIKIETKDEILDLSFKNKLSQLQNHLLTN